MFQRFNFIILYIVLKIFHQDHIIKIISSPLGDVIGASHDQPKPIGNAIDFGLGFERCPKILLTFLLVQRKKAMIFLLVQREKR